MGELNKIRQWFFTKATYTLKKFQKNKPTLIHSLHKVWTDLQVKIGQLKLNINKINKFINKLL